MFIQTQIITALLKFSHNNVKAFNKELTKKYSLSIEKVPPIPHEKIPNL